MQHQCLSTWQNIWRDWVKDFFNFIVPTCNFDHFVSLLYSCPPHLSHHLSSSHHYSYSFPNQNSGETGFHIASYVQYMIHLCPLPFFPARYINALNSNQFCYHAFCFCNQATSSPADILYNKSDNLKLIFITVTHFMESSNPANSRRSQKVSESSFTQ